MLDVLALKVRKALPDFDLRGRSGHRHAISTVCFRELAVLYGLNQWMFTARLAKLIGYWSELAFLALPGASLPLKTVEKIYSTAVFTEELAV